VLKKLGFSIVPLEELAKSTKLRTQNLREQHFSTVLVFATI